MFWWFLDPEAPVNFGHVQPENEMLPFSAKHIFLGQKIVLKRLMVFLSLENGEFYSYHFTEDSMGSP